MSLEVWYESDIQNALGAAGQANESALKAADTESNPYALGYQAGFRAALTTIALAFGLVPVQAGVVDQPSPWQPVFLKAGENR